MMWQEFGDITRCMNSGKAPSSADRPRDAGHLRLQPPTSRRGLASESPRCTFLSVDSDHGFSPVSMEQKVIDLTKDWLLSLRS